MAAVGLTEDVLRSAYMRASAKPLPVVFGCSDERIRRLAGMCRELHILLGDQPFYLPTRKVAELFGVHWTSIGIWLRGLEVLKHIALAPGEVRKRGAHRSPRYIYTLETQLLETSTSTQFPISRGID